MSHSEEFDVFLCHNSQERAVVEKIREQLKQWKIYAWLDKYDFEPFRPWQKQLEEIIPQIKAAAIFIGSSGVGPWANIEMSAFLSEFAQNQIRMGLVILPGCPDELIKDVPRFMKSFHWVDFRQSDPDPMKQLVWGITGVKPSGLGSVSPPPSVGISVEVESPSQVFKFNVVTVNSKGQEIKREKAQAPYRTEQLGKDVTLEMVSIPEGSFEMGMPAEERKIALENMLKYNVKREDAEKWLDRSIPQHQVELPAFWMGKYAVTNAQWQAVMGTKPSEKYDRKFQGDKQPVVGISWHEARAFCKKLKLSANMGREVRLPTEAEWEYACRAGTTTPFHFGETISTNLVNYNGNYPYADAPKGEYRERTVDVDGFSPNAWGLHQMHGNVWEWCLDEFHDNYSTKSDHLKIHGNEAWGDLNVNEDDNRFRLLRGGSWDFNAQYCLSAYRSRLVARAQDDYFGFRVVCGLR